MGNLEAVLATYIDLNLLLAGLAVIWFAVRRLMRMSKFAWAFSAQLSLLKLVVLSAFTFPILLSAISYFVSGAPVVPLSLSEMVLSQYLQGNIQLNPSLLDGILTARQNFVTQLTDFSHPLFTALVVGIVATALLMVVRALLTAHKLRRLLLAAHEWRTFGKLKFMLSDTIHIPFSTRGLFLCYIVLPSSMLANKTDTKVALSHELQHLRQRDVDWEVVAVLLTPLFFWNPAYHYFKREIEELRELTCDQIVLQKGFLSPREYCECLLRVCANKFKRPSLFRLRIPKVALIDTEAGMFSSRSERLLANRLLSAVEAKKFSSSKRPAIVIAAVLVAVSGILSLAVQKPTDWSHDRLMLSTIINLERLEQRNRIGLGTYRSY